MIFLQSTTTKYVHAIAASFFAFTLAINTNAQTCSGAADIWFANDESGSVSEQEFFQSLDFIYQVADSFVFDNVSGAKAAVSGWASANQQPDYIFPATGSFSDPDDTGLNDPNYDGSNADFNIITDGDGTGVRELYLAKDPSGGTELDDATAALTNRIDDNTDSNNDDVTNNGRRNDLAQIAVILTDASSGQLTNSSEGGGSNWSTALANLRNAGPNGTNIVLMLIDAAAAAYNSNTAVETLIDGFVSDHDVTLFVGSTYADIANPAQNYISGFVNAVCPLTDIALYLKNQPRVYSDNNPFTVTFEFSEDVTGFMLNDINVANGSVGNLIQENPSLYTADITPDGSFGDITIDVPTAAAQETPTRQSRAAEQGISFYDGDGDGVGDTNEGSSIDSDGDGVFDNQDIDSDNDGIPDAIENDPSIGAIDTDGDGIFDYLDLDSDNDGISDLIESGSTISPTLDTGLDTATNSGNGRIELSNSFGNDGLADALQTGGNGGALNYTIADTDNDGIEDFRDLDSDNDAIADLVESGITFAVVTTIDGDTDGDIDGVSENAVNSVGTDGILDSLQANTDGDPIAFIVADTDQDGIADFRDLDTDGDGIPDLVESANSSAIASDTNSDGQLQDSESLVGNDGIPEDAQSGSDGGTINLPANSDSTNEIGTEVPDYRDLDSDNDGLYDVDEARAPNNNGDATADGGDSNSDGMIDAGFVVSPTDTSPTDSPDYRNVDSNGPATNDDNDSDPVINALDNAPDDGVLDDTTDSDGDGIPDVNDDDSAFGVQPTAAILVLETAGDTIVSETGTTDSFNVVLQRQPLSNIVLTLQVDDVGEATLDQTTLTFTSSNWDTAQTVTVTGLTDDFIDGTQTPTVDIAVEDDQSSDEYDGLAAIVGVDVLDTTLDSDSDGISDALEGTGDSDNDGTPDNLDTDSDNDGIDDSVEAGDDPEIATDTDGDGIPNNLELDSDGDGIIDSLEVGPTPNSPIDTDNDTIPDYIDLDSDNDGIPDNLEDTNSQILSNVDAAGGSANGIDDAIDILATLGSDNNGNGVDDTREPSNVDAPADVLPNHRDLDSDGDGILDIIEANNVPSPLGLDSDGDGLDDAIDVDQTSGEDLNGNGVDDALEPRDSDSDGKPDYLDIDSDNDGIPDSLEANPDGGVLTALNGLDTDSDGIDDAIDFNNGGPNADSNGNGISDSGEPADTDGDGVPDYRDLDSDNDSLLDVDEAGGNDINGDGTVDNLADEGTLINPTNSDSDTTPNFRDLESTNPNNDGSGPFDLDSNPNPPVDSSPTDGIVDDTNDPDGDGVTGDADPEPNNFGSNIDSDGDLIPDAMDLDDDNDGIPDAAECDAVSGIGAVCDTPVDTDGDGIFDHLDLDSDNDGIFDVLESDNGNTDINRDGLVDNFTDSLPAALGDGLHDPIDPAFDPVDTDNDGRDDYRDIDSDGDTITDLSEANTNGVPLSALDSDGDGIVDNVDSVSGLTLDSANQATDIQPRDSDGDNQPDFRDLDSDNDGFSDQIEASDNDNSGTSDSLEPGNGELDTAVSGAGSSGVFSLALLILVLLKRHARKICMTLAAAFISAQTYSAETDCGYEFEDGKFNACWYIGIGLGVSHVDPEGSSNNWSTNDDSSDGWELSIGRQFTPKWFGEFKYADIGEAGLGNTNPAATAAFPNANISYEVYSALAGYYLRSHEKTLRPYLKVGASAIQNKAGDDGGTVEFRDVTSMQLALGAGVQYRKQQSPWMFRVNVDSYDRDAWFAGLSAHRLLGKKRSGSKQTANSVVTSSVTAPADTTPVISEPIPTTPIVVPVIPTVQAQPSDCSQFNSVIEGVNFRTNSAKLTNSALAVLKPYASSLANQPRISILISAHTDWVGSGAYNQKLSSTRAQSVADFFISEGVSPSQIRSSGYGESRPIADNNTVEGRAKNRRVEIEVTNPEQCM